MDLFNQYKESYQEGKTLPQDFYTDEIMQQLEVAVGKEFKYGSAVEDDQPEILEVVDES